VKTTIYVAERIRTLDPSRPVARALAVRGGTVLAVDPVEHPAAALVDARVLATVVAGAEVFRA
jgi:hypothetical protein